MHNFDKVEIDLSKMSLEELQQAQKETRKLLAQIELAIRLLKMSNDTPH